MGRVCAGVGVSVWGWEGLCVGVCANRECESGFIDFWLILNTVFNSTYPSHL